MVVTRTLIRPHGPLRPRLLARAAKKAAARSHGKERREEHAQKEAETDRAAIIEAWIASPGLQPPK
jgi:hypothetical protein